MAKEILTSLSNVVLHKMDAVSSCEHEDSLEFATSFTSINEDGSQPYYEKKILKALTSVKKKLVHLPKNHWFMETLNLSNYMEKTKTIASAWSKAYHDFALEPVGAYFMFAETEFWDKKYFVVLKLNLRKTEKVIFQDGQFKVVFDYGLPTAGSEVQEALIVEQETNSVFILEKKTKAQEDGKNHFYMTEDFLFCDKDFSDKEKFSAITKVAKTINSEFNYQMEDLIPVMKDAILNCSEEKEVTPVNIVKTIFNGDLQAEKAAAKLFTEMGIDYDAPIENLKAAGNLETCKIKLQDGTTSRMITIPLKAYLEQKDTKIESNKASGSFHLSMSNIHEVDYK